MTSRTLALEFLALFRGPPHPRRGMSHLMLEPPCHKTKTFFNENRENTNMSQHPIFYRIQKIRYR